MAEKLVTMLMLCFVPTKDGQLREAWRVEQRVTLDHCLRINRVMSGGGRASAITVRCDAD